MNEWGKASTVYSDYRDWLFLKPGILSKAGESSTGNFQAALVWAVWAASFCRIFWNKEGFFTIRGWPLSTTLQHGPRSNTGPCVSFSIFLCVISCLCSGDLTLGWCWNWDRHHLQTSQTKGFRRGQSCCFKLDFFCLCVLWILFIQFPVPTNTQKMENKFYQNFPHAISCEFHLI